MLLLNLGALFIKYIIQFLSQIYGFEANSGHYVAHSHHLLSSHHILHSPRNLLPD